MMSLLLTGRAYGVYIYISACCVSVGNIDNSFNTITTSDKIWISCPHVQANNKSRQFPISGSNPLPPRDYGVALPDLNLGRWSGNNRDLPHNHVGLESMRFAQLGTCTTSDFRCNLFFMHHLFPVNCLQIREMKQSAVILSIGNGCITNSVTLISTIGQNQTCTLWEHLINPAVSTANEGNQHI